MGDPNASLPTPQPTYYRPMFGAFGLALPATCLTFVSRAAQARRRRQAAGTCSGSSLPVKNTRKIGKRDMVRNSRDAEDRSLARDLRGHRRRRPCDGAAGEDDLTQPEVFLQLTERALILIEKILGNRAIPNGRCASPPPPWRRLRSTIGKRRRTGFARRPRAASRSRCRSIAAHSCATATCSSGMQARHARSWRRSACAT